MNDHPHLKSRTVALVATCAVVAVGGAVAVAADGDGQPATATSMTRVADHSSAAKMPSHGSRGPMTPDSHAPAGASGHWLPKEPWVMQHWLPYDESRLFALLGIDRRALHTWLRVDGHTIDQLAAAHGHGDRAKLVEDLLAPRKGSVDAATYEQLRSRTDDTLTQSHLALHVFFHLFHDQQIPAHAQTILGVSKKQFRQLRRQGMTIAQIGARGGRSRTQVATAAMKVLTDSQRAGQAQKATTPEQSAAMLAVQRKHLNKWLDKQRGAAKKKHGAHAGSKKHGAHAG
jgi:hypothetical protein